MDPARPDRSLKLDGRPLKISIVGTTENYSCRPDQKVQHALESSSETAIPVGCRQGGCGVCKVRIISGCYETGKMSRAHVSQKEEEAGVALCCRLYPRSDLVIERIPPKNSE